MYFSPSSIVIVRRQSFFDPIVATANYYFIPTTTVLYTQ